MKPPAEPCVTPCVTDWRAGKTPEEIANLERLGAEFRAAHEKTEQALDDIWRGQKELIAVQKEMIARLEAEVKDLQECWDEAEAELADIKADEAAQ